MPNNNNLLPGFQALEKKTMDNENLANIPDQISRKPGRKTTSFISNYETLSSGSLLVSNERAPRYTVDDTLSPRRISADDVKRRWRVKQLAKQGGLPDLPDKKSWLEWLRNCVPCPSIGGRFDIESSKGQVHRDAQVRRVARASF